MLFVDLDAAEGRHVRSGGDEDVLGFQDLFLGALLGALHRHLAGGRDGAFAGDIVDLVLLHQELDALGQLLDHRILAPHHGLEVDRESLDLDAVVAEFLRRHMVVVGRLQQGLGRDAPDVQAGAAQGAAFLDDGRLEAQLRRPDGGDVAARAAADDDQVIRIAHGFSVPALNVDQDALRVLDALLDAHQEGNRLASIDDTVVV